MSVSPGNKRLPLLPRGGLAMRYTLFFLGAFMAVFTIALLYSFGYAKRILERSAAQKASEMTDLTISRITNVIRAAEQVPITLSYALTEEKPDYRMLMKLISSYVLDDTVVFGSAIAFEPYMYSPKYYRFCPYIHERSSAIVEKDLSSEEYNYFDQDWYRIPKQTGLPVWSEPYYDKGGGDTLMCTYSVPFFRRIHGRIVFTGVLTMDISTGTFRHIINSARISQTGFNFLVSAKGTLITYPYEQYINKNIKDFIGKGKNRENREVIGKMLKGERMFMKVQNLEHVKVPSWIYFAPVPHTGWILVITFPTHELYADLYSLFRILVVIFILSLVSMAVITMFLTRKFIAPISRLVDATQRIGQGDFTAPIPEYKSTDEISQLTGAFSKMKEELIRYISNLQEATIAREKIESELNVAHEIQMGMLPKDFPERSDWDLSALLNPAKAVGGDLYDFHFLDKDHLFIAIGDVSGKGIPASLFMVVARTLFRSLVNLKSPLNQSVFEINREICQENPNNMFVTFIAGIVDLRSGCFTYTNAGHNPPFLLKDSGHVVRLKEVHGIPIGIFEHATYSSGTIMLKPGDSLLLYTDGMTDALGIDGELFGEKRLLGLVKQNSKCSPALLIKKLESGIMEFMTGAQQADDIALLVLKSKQSSDQNKTAFMKQIILLNQLGELNRLVATLEQLSEEWNIPAKVSMELNLVLEELFTNVVFYAYDDGRDHEIMITFENPSPGRVQIRFEDDGKPFNLLDKDTEATAERPVQERQIGGLGIHFIKQLVNEIVYERKAGKNIVLLSRNY